MFQAGQGEAPRAAPALPGLAVARLSEVSEYRGACTDLLPARQCRATPAVKQPRACLSAILAGFGKHEACFSLNTSPDAFSCLFADRLIHTHQKQTDSKTKK